MKEKPAASPVKAQPYQPFFDRPLSLSLPFCWGFFSKTKMMRWWYLTCPHLWFCPSLLSASPFTNLQQMSCPAMLILGLLGTENERKWGCQWRHVGWALEQALETCNKSRGSQVRGNGEKPGWGLHAASQHILAQYQWGKEDGCTSWDLDLRFTELNFRLRVSNHVWPECLFPLWVHTGCVQGIKTWGKHQGSWKPPRATRTLWSPHRVWN